MDIAVFSASALMPASLAISSSFDSSAWISEALMTFQSAGAEKLRPLASAVTVAQSVTGPVGSGFAEAGPPEGLSEAAPAAWVAGADAPPVDASLEPPCAQPEARRARETTEATASARKRENGDRVTGFPFSGCVDAETLSDSVRSAPHPE